MKGGMRGEISQRKRRKKGEEKEEEKERDGSWGEKEKERDGSCGEKEKERDGSWREKKKTQRKQETEEGYDRNLVRSEGKLLKRKNVCENGIKRWKKKWRKESDKE